MILPISLRIATVDRIHVAEVQRRFETGRFIEP